jgi:glycosyltransferase involved in cell wall biosynthesis
MKATVDRVDTVFAHMIPKYVLAGAPWFNTHGIPVTLWFAHGSVGLELRIAHRLASRIVSSTEEGFRLESKKLSVLSQGIDTSNFRPTSTPPQIDIALGVGRLDRIKCFETLIKAVGILDRTGTKLNLEIVGEPSSGGTYLRELTDLVESLGLTESVRFQGSVPHNEIVSQYRAAGVFLNDSNTGSLDKTEVEAMASGTPVISSNNSYVDMIGASDLEGSVLTFPSNDAEMLAGRIESLMEMDGADYKELCDQSRELAVRKHNVGALMGQVASVLRETTRTTGTSKE